MKYLILFISLTLTVCCESKDLPCDAVWKDSGFVCSCNKTYCDTIKRPRRLAPGEYHVYYTSNSMPGFNHYINFFEFRKSPVNVLKLKVDSKNKKQKLRGFGSSFTDSFGYSFNRLSIAAQNNFLKSVFSVEGIEYSLCRVVWGSSDFSLNEYSYVPNFDPSLSSFNLTGEDYTNKIWPIMRANTLSGRKIHLLGTSWSAPGWMKTNNNYTTGYLKRQFEQTWADYHVKILDAFKKEGVDFWGITTGNEPVTLIAIKTDIPHLAMFPEQQREWIIENLGPSLSRSGYENISIILLDDQRKYSPWWMDIVLRSKEAEKYVNGVGLHWYMDAQASPLIMDEIFLKYPSQEIIYTESSINPVVSIPNSNYQEFQEIHPKLGDWRRAALYITSIIEGLLHRVTGYIDWNMALDMKGGPTGMGFTCDAPIIINYQSDEFYKQPMFYAIGHFSKFLQPESIMIDIQLIQSEAVSPMHDKEESIEPTRFPLPFLYTDVKYVAALNSDGTTTVILFNPRNTTVKVSIHCENQKFAYLVLEAESLTTIIY